MKEATLTCPSPSALILARSEALRAGDFDFVFASYHTESNFRRQFELSEDYRLYAKENLQADFQIIDCQVLDEKLDAQESQVLFLVTMRAFGVVQRYAELAWLRREENAWRYHRGQKITAEDLPAQPQKLTFADFDRLDPVTIF